MGTKLTPLTFSKNKPQTMIQCQKIIFKEIKMILGDIRFIMINFEYNIFGVSYKSDFRPGSFNNLFIPDKDGIYYFKDKYFDFSNNNDGVLIKTLYKPFAIIDKNLDFEFIISYENL